MRNESELQVSIFKFFLILLYLDAKSYAKAKWGKKKDDTPLNIEVDKKRADSMCKFNLVMSQIKDAEDSDDEECIFIFIFIFILVIKRDLKYFLLPNLVLFAQD